MPGIWALVPFCGGWDTSEVLNEGGTSIQTRLERLIYYLFGTNLVIGPQIREQIRLLRDMVPATFRQRALDDLGCGDGKVTLLLKDVFLPRKIRGFDVNPYLVGRARRRGIEAEVRNLETDVPSGELAIMWGVLHHLKDREGCLKKIKENYPLAFIREPLRNKAIKGLEMGKPLVREEIEHLVQKHLTNARVSYHGHCIFIFYVSPELA